MNQSGKIQYLEGIRGVAALMVFFHHFLLAFFPSFNFAGDPATSHLGTFELNYWRTPLSVFTNGEFMVSLFFVLSGFVLSRSYFLKNDTNILVSAAVRRFFRLYIPLAAVLILAYIVLICNLGLVHQCVPITRSQWLAETVPVDTSFLTFLKCLTYHTMFVWDNRYVTSTGTLSIELYGSMLVFATLALTHRLRAKWMFFIITGIVAYFIFNEFYISFMFGICLNYFEKLQNKPIKFRWLWASLLLTIGFIMGGYPTYPWHIERATFYGFITSPAIINNYQTIHIIGATFIIMGAMLSSTLQKIFSGKIFSFLGEVSFSAYLIHPVIVTTLSLAIFLGLYNAFGHYTISVTVSLLISLVVTLVLAKLMTNWVDKPGIQFSKYVYSRFFKPNE